MTNFKELDQDEIRKLLEGQENVLTPELTREETFFRHVTCPMCRSSSHESFISSTRPFYAGSILPTKVLRCLSCSTEFDPYSGFITKAGIKNG